MKDLERNREVIKRFLLGELVEEDQLRVEERFLTDREYKDEVLMVEDELLEDFLAGALSDREKEGFSTHYLSAPRQIQRLKVAKAFLKYAEDNSPPVRVSPSHGFRAVLDLFRSQSRQLQFASVIVVVAALVGGLLILYAWQQRAQEAKLMAELAQLNNSQHILNPNESVIAVNLAPVYMRQNGQLPTATFTPQTEIVQLRVPVVSHGYQNYRVGLRTVEGEQIVEFEIKPQVQGNTLTVQLPSRILSSADYIINLRGLKADAQIEDIGDYYFRVLKGQ